MSAAVRNLCLAAVLALAGCAVGPDYERPAMDLPEKLDESKASVPALERWWTVFGDPVLDKRIEDALAANRDLVAAAARVDQARAQSTLAAADQQPTVSIEGQRSRDRASERGAFPLPPEAIETHTHRAQLRVSWELDFWGKYRRASEAARAELLAAEAGRDAVRASLVAEVARAHFALAALDANTDIARTTTEGRRTVLGLLRQRLDAGVVSELEVRQYEAEVRAAEALLAQLSRERTVAEGTLAVLMGRSPRAVYGDTLERGSSKALSAAEVPPGLPSDLLRRRPDLREAEARLVAANARIGVARAAYYPSISLTGLLGSESQSLSDLFSGPARTFSLAAGLLQPVYGAGQIAANVDLADARTREAAARYEKAVAQAFREVRDAIAAQSTRRDELAARMAREAALAKAEALAKARYDGGVTGMIEWLDAVEKLLAARTEAVNADRDRRGAIVDLYLALGG